MVRDRGEGKTTETILWLLRAPFDEYGRSTRVLICATEERAAHLLREYPALKGFIHTAQSFSYGRGNVEIAVDDAEAFIYRAIPGAYNIKRITLTGKSI